VIKFVITVIERIILDRLVGTYTEDQPEVEVMTETKVRGRGLGHDGSGYKQTHEADTASQLGSGSDDMLTQLMTQLACRLSPTTPTSATASVAH
jgi:hypothetical protein